MPEGPEIRRAADEVEKAIAGKQVIGISFGLEHLKPWESRLTGAVVQKVETRGKAMLIRLDNGLNIYSHNQLYGRWYCCPREQFPDTRRQLRLAIHTLDRSALLYSASDIQVLTDNELADHPFLKKLGPDVLCGSLNTRQVLARLQSKQYHRRQLGNFLTDQSFVAGLGNYLRCEILFAAGIHPSARPVDLRKDQLTRLAAAILALPRQSYESAGITQDMNAAQALMQQGSSFENARFWVFRRGNEPCRRCGELIQRLSQGGQTCYLCPHCQPSSRA